MGNQNQASIEENTAFGVNERDRIIPQDVDKGPDWSCTTAPH